MLMGKKGEGRIEVGELRDSVLRKIKSMIKGRNKVVLRKGLVCLGKIWRLYFNEDVLDKIIRICRNCGKETDVSGRCNRSYCKECAQRALRNHKQSQVNKEAERECLACGRKFKSDGWHDRRCNECEGKDELYNVTVYKINTKSLTMNVGAE